MFSRVLIANRGEIAVRIARALRELSVHSIAVYAQSDAEAVHVAYADESHLLGEGMPTETYLNIGRIIELARAIGAEAIHPGYGFLAENAAFASACRDAGIVFIGPSPEAIAAMGSKTAARALMTAAGVPVVPGTTEPVADVDAARAAIEAGIGYPAAVKAASGAIRN